MLLERNETAGSVISAPVSEQQKDWDYVHYWQLWHRNWDNLDVETIQRLCQLQGKSVLEVGCGDGRITTMLAPYCERILGVDLEPRFIEIGKQRIAESGLTNVELKVMDACRLELADESVDFVLFPWVLQMVSDPGAAVREAYRALRPGGMIVVIGLLSDADYDRIIDRFVPGVPRIDPIACYEEPLAEVFGVSKVEKIPDVPFAYFFGSKETAYDAFDFALDYWYGKKISSADRAEMQVMVDGYADGQKVRIIFPASVYVAAK